MAVRKNEAKTDIDLFNYLTTKKAYSKPWAVKKTAHKTLQAILDKSSKSGTGKRGEPDLIYVNESKKLFILIENKHSIKDHVSKSGDQPKDYAVDGVKFYLSTALQLIKSDKNLQKFFASWRMVGIAFSGDINDSYNHLITNFIVVDHQIQQIESKEILDEEDYIAFFENVDVEKIAANISSSSIEINRLLRAIDSQKRPILLSGLMICLYDKSGFNNDFKNGYRAWTNPTIISNIPTTIKRILSNEGIDNEKIEVLLNELTFIKTDKDLNETDILIDILKKLEDNVIPLFNKKTNYDIIGRFYEEFLRYAGVSNVKKGIVLTPSHITKLFTDLVDFKTNDVLFDSCCGTGAFLIAGMNKLVDLINESTARDKSTKIQSIKTNQLVGFEKSSSMYSLAISNMLFRGDGKSRIFNVDAFSTEATAALAKLKSEGIIPSIGFINPPYGGKDNQSNPTKKEIQFLETMLDSVSRFGVIIAPLSAYFKDSTIRNRILTKHTLKYVINMPGDLFMPNAATHTAVAVFETNQPHNGKNVVFYDLSDDGFVLSKNKGRTDVLNKWRTFRGDLLEKVKNKSVVHDNVKSLNTKIQDDDEWIIQAHAKSNYSKLLDGAFVESVKRQLIFSLKLKYDLIDKELDEISLLEILGDSISKESILAQKIVINPAKWKEFRISEIFEYERGDRLVTLDQVKGDIAYISSTKINNGIDNYIIPPEDMKVYKNAMTINNSGSVGFVFYHPYSFVCSDHCTMLNLKSEYSHLDLYLAIFLRPILEAMSPKFNFAREISDARLAKETIILPVDKKRNPDWNYMRDYIKTLPYTKSLEQITT